MREKSFEFKTLGKIALISSGSSAPQESSQFTLKNSGMPFVRMQDLGRYGKTYNLTKVADYIEEKTSKKLKIFPAGSILIPKSGASIRLNHRAILGMDAHVVSHLAIIQVNSSVVLNKYLYFWLLTIDFSNIAHQADLPSLKISDLESLEVPLPPLEIQKNIISILEEIDELRQKQRKALELTRQMIPSLFNEMFGNPSENFKSYEVVALRKAVLVSNKKLNPQDYPTSDFFYIGLENIESGTGNIAGSIQQQGAHIKSLKNAFESGDILYGKLRPYLNKVYLTKNSGICSTDILVLKTNINYFTPEYISSTIQSRYFLSITSSLMQGANLPRISSEALLNIPILIPPLEMQKTFSEKYRELIQLIYHQELALQKLDCLFDSMLDQIFFPKNKASVQ